MYIVHVQYMYYKALLSGTADGDPHVLSLFGWCRRSPHAGWQILLEGDEMRFDACGPMSGVVREKDGPFPYTFEQRLPPSAVERSIAV
jgi:hypothetical protein